MKGINWRAILYWGATLLFVLGVGATGIRDLTAEQSMALHVTALGYPAYLQVFLGVAKLLGAGVILLPRLPRLKEWAYAGMTFELLGATYSHLAQGDPGSELVLPVVLLACLAVSYVLRPALRRLAAPSEDNAVMP